MVLQEEDTKCGDANFSVAKEAGKRASTLDETGLFHAGKTVANFSVLDWQDSFELTKIIHSTQHIRFVKNNYLFPFIECRQT